MSNDIIKVSEIVEHLADGGKIVNALGAIYTQETLTVKTMVSEGPWRKMHKRMVLIDELDELLDGMKSHEYEAIKYTRSRCGIEKTLSITYV